MAQTQKGVVLIADGEAAVRDVLHFYLKRAGYQVVQAEDGQDALVEMSKVHPDLILADLSLSGVSGDNLCRLVKQNPATKDIFFILAIQADDEDAGTTVDALSLGADDAISKPLRSRELVARVESAFRIIAMQKEIKEQNRRLLAYREGMQRDMELASHLQLSLLPEAGTAGPYRYKHRYRPFGGVGGDIYAISELPYGGVALLMADVSGHGMTAALISAMVRTSFESQIRSRGGPLQWAQAMNRHLARNTLEEQYATAVLVKFEPMEALLSYVCAGHVPPIYIRGGASGGGAHPVFLQGASHPLGMDESMSFAEHSNTFAAGDRLILYTDGLTEVWQGMVDGGMVQLCSDLPMDPDEAAEHIFRQARRMVAGSDFSDDVTLLVIDCLGQ